MSTAHIVLVGSSGRMGRRIIACASGDARVRIVAALVRAGSSAVGHPMGEHADAPRGVIDVAANTPVDVVIDFSSADGNARAIAIAKAQRSALLVGTTGLDRDTIAELRSLSQSLPVLVAANTGLGIAALSRAISGLAGMLGPSFAVSIVEAHHHAKKDAPSGTALRLADALRGGGAPVPSGSILSIRGGDTIGEHTIRFDGPGESIEITHRAVTRDLFAKGALTAAAWLAGKPAGWYSIDDVVGTA